MKYLDIQKELKKLANPAQAKLLGRFFKTGKGEYGEGDVFLGVMVPQQRKVVKKFRELSLPEIQKLLNSKFHEERLVGVLILVEQYQNKNSKLNKQNSRKEEIHKFYLKNTKKINNWDLVDLSAPKIVGAHLLNNNKKILYNLVKSKNLWERRIAVLATFEFIRHHQFADAIKIAKILLNDRHDLIHKAVGWMLREIGKRNEKILRKFLDKHATKTPRTMLRYSIEKLPEKDRRMYLEL